MKKFILMTMTATLMAGCSTDEENECTSPPNEYPVEIMASAGVSGIQTRSPINTGQSVTAGFIASASGGDCGRHLYRFDHNLRHLFTHPRAILPR